MLVSWSLTSLFSTNMAISETKGLYVKSAIVKENICQIEQCQAAGLDTKFSEKVVS